MVLLPFGEKMVGREKFVLASVVRLMDWPAAFSVTYGTPAES
jgi:hypothetical protein